MSLDDEIDGLYRLPSEAFTAARNALARRAGMRGVEVKRLVKPNAAAWAVNQLFWRHRPLFDALSRASERRRATHVKCLAGKTGDRELVDACHRAALAVAAEAAADFFRERGDTVSTTTAAAIMRTIDAVPSPHVQGRLARPLEAIGFSALASLVAPGGLPDRLPAEIVAISSAKDGVFPSQPRKAPRAARPTSDGASRRLAAQKRRLETMQERLRIALSRENAAQQAHARAKAAVEEVADKVRRLAASLEAAQRDRTEH
jgi:hypothetical protein